MTVAISAVSAREILDSRGNPTVEVDVELEDGTLGRAAVPSGASTGAHEACELRDNEKGRFLGRGVRKAVENVSEHLADAIIDLNVTDQAAIDKAMIEVDGTPKKAPFGGNSILACSLACAHAGARVSFVPLFLYLEGGSIPAPDVLNGSEPLGTDSLALPGKLSIDRKLPLRSDVCCRKAIFEAILLKLDAQLIASIHRRCSGTPAASDVDDIAQEARRMLWEEIANDKFGPLTLESWQLDENLTKIRMAIYRHVKNVRTKLHKKSAMRQKVLDDLVLMAKLRTTSTAEDDLPEAREQVHLALEKCPGHLVKLYEQRKAGMRFGEIARSEEVSDSTIRVRFHRLINHLQRCVEPNRS